MIENNSTSGYIFGPDRDLDISFSLLYSKRGIAYESLHHSVQLYVQVICHAVHQIKVGPLDDYNSKCRWRLFRNENSTYDSYNLYYDDELVLSLAESSTDDYVVNYFDFTGEWYRDVCCYAVEHCNRFGRQ